MFKDTKLGTTHYDFDSCEICVTCYGHYAKTSLQGLCDACTLELTTKFVAEEFKNVLNKLK